MGGLALEGPQEPPEDPAQLPRRGSLYIRESVWHHPGIMAAPRHFHLPHCKQHGK